MEIQTPLNNAQLEILKLFSRHLDDADLLEIKRIITKYLADKANKLATEVWKEKGWTDKDMDALSKKHLRTPYKINK